MYIHFRLFCYVRDDRAVDLVGQITVSLLYILHQPLVLSIATCIIGASMSLIRSNPFRQCDRDSSLGDFISQYYKPVYWINIQSVEIMSF